VRRAGRWALALSAAALFNAASLACADGEKRMATSEEIAAKVLGLPEERYYTYDLALDLELTERLDGHDFEGLAIAGPKKVDLAKRDVVPILMASVESGLRQWEIAAEKNHVLVAVNLRTGRVHAGPAYPLPHGKRPGPVEDEPKPEGLMAEATITGTASFDLRRIAGLPDGGASYAVTLISFDRKSNTIRVDVTGPADSNEAPASVDPEPGDGGLPSYRKEADSPPLPRRGVAMVFGTAGQSAVYASFRVEAESEILAAAVAVFERNKPSARLAAVVAPATLDGPEATGYFALDLKERLAGFPPAGEFVAYALLGTHTSGPSRPAVK
jgi:hypothetical protein